MDSAESLERTLGDGMETLTLPLSETLTHIKINRTTKPTFNPIIPTGKIINTIPKYIPNDRKNINYALQKQKEPKFVPYEPFKCAVEPILPKRKKKRTILTSEKITKNNVNINDLVNQMADIRLKELEKLTVNQEVISAKQWKAEK